MRVLPPTATLMLCLLAPISMGMASGPAPSANAAAPAAPPANAYRQLQALDAQLTRVAYRLTTANVAYCDDVQGHVGIALHTAAQYKDMGRATFGFAQPVQVLALAPGSAAALSGVLVDDAIMAVDGLSAEQAIGDPNRRGGEQLIALTENVQARVDGALKQGRASQWELWRNGQRMTVHLTPVPACRSRWQIMAGHSDHAGTDGQTVTISVDIAQMAMETGGDDALAAVAAHELGHILLGHRVYLASLEAKARAARGGDARVARKTLSAAQRRAERDADLLSQWLLANAGYNNEPGMALYARIASRNALYFSPKHGSWKNRIAAMRAENAMVMATPPDAQGRRAPPLLYGKGSYRW